MSRHTTQLDDRLYEYFLEVSVRDDDLHRRLREETAKLENARMQISAEQGQFLTLFVGAMNAKLALELGTFTGYSALVVAMALPDGGKVIACDISDEWTRIGRRYWAEAGVADKIDLRLQPAVTTLDELITAGESGSFDFAFVDADKGNYDAYYERCLTLLRTGGVVAIDNVLWGGAVADNSRQDEDTVALRALNRKLQEDPRVDINMLPIGDGLTLAVKR